LQTSVSLKDNGEEVQRLGIPNFRKLAERELNASMRTCLYGRVCIVSTRKEV
jgi:hypothetical protein